MPYLPLTKFFCLSMTVPPPTGRRSDSPAFWPYFTPVFPPLVEMLLDELNANSRVLRLAKIERKKRDTNITGLAATVILRLYMEESSRSLRLC